MTYEALPEKTLARQTLARPVSQWREIFREQTDGSPTGVSARIIADLWGYGTRSNYKTPDIISLANALVAFEEEYGQ